MEIKLKWGQEELGIVTYNGRMEDNRKNKESLEIDISSWEKLDNQVRCHVRYDQNKNEFIIFPYERNLTVKKIALILESPHKDEFTYEFKPLQPMNGSSGYIFKKNICQKMKTWFDKSNKEEYMYEIMIFNPVQYQASLYHYLNNLIPYNRLPENISFSYGKLRDSHNAKLRDDVWNILFDSEIVNCQTTFLSEIIAYSPHYIVNACTGKKNAYDKWCIINKVNDMEEDNSLGAMVRKALVKNLEETTLWKKVYYRDDYHPSYWSIQLHKNNTNGVQRKYKIPKT